MSSSASGTMAEGSRPAKPASRSTGADGSRQTVRYARTGELVSTTCWEEESVGGQRQLTTYVIPTVTSRGRESNGLRHLRVERRRTGHRPGQRRAGDPGDLSHVPRRVVLTRDGVVVVCLG